MSTWKRPLFFFGGLAAFGLSLWYYGDPGKAKAVTGGYTFFMGLSLMMLFLWYFGTETDRNRRWIGSFVAIAVGALSLFYFQRLGVEKGIELQGGISVSLQIMPNSGNDVSKDAQRQVIKVLEKRLNASGAKDMVLAPEGSDRVFIQIPGMSKEAADELIKNATAAAKLEFSLVEREEMQGQAQRVAEGLDVVPGMRALPAQKLEGEEDKDAATPEAGDKFYLVKQNADMSGKHVTGAGVHYGQEGWEIYLEFDDEGSTQFGELSKNYGRQLAIIVDGKVISAPGFNSGRPIYGTCQITGSFTETSARALASALENPLENPLKVISQNYISPTMGESSVKQGIWAGVSGLLISLVFIVLYYRFAGLIAMVGILINIAIIFGAMALFKFTLTLPGIAGIVLIIGMAIDANVLIFERLREEMATGKSFSAALATAYDRAFTAIFDSNLTSLITSIILYAVATGTVRGFAITLTIGIIGTLFAAVLVTRVCFRWLLDFNLMDKANFASLFTRTKIDFLKWSRPALLGSAAAVALSLIVVPIIDPRGIDLKEGDRISVKVPSGSLTQAQVEEALAGVKEIGTPVVQIQSTMGEGGGEFVSIRTAFGKSEAVLQALQKTLKIDPSTAETTSIGSQVGGETLRASILSLVLALVAILIYLTVRFEFAFALGAIVALAHDVIIVTGLLAIFGQDVSLITIGALLTIAGYSINDTIVVFDFVRDGLKTKRGSIVDVFNYCLNATLSRTIITGGTTIVVVITLLIFGGPALRAFALPILFGILVGTYSSVYVASPITLWWVKKSGTNLRREILDAEQSKIGPNLAQEG
ncbi:MAG: protein translocase subunit SecD [Verrucomicrobiales bacterium]|nr:protein translocase subunit SecD [Verrucomicrobiales bacterium]